jgi:WD40 repeat protein
MYVTSFDNHAVVRFSPSSGAFLGVFATASNSPGGITFGPDGNLYTTVSVVNRVERFDGVTGAPLGAFTSGHLFDPCPLIFGPNGDLFVHSQDDYKIVEFNGATGAFVRNFVTESSPFNPSSEIVFGPDGNLYTGNLTAGPINDGVRRYNGVTGAFIDNFVPGDGTFWSTGVTFTPVPEPQSVISGIIAFCGVLFVAWRQRCGRHGLTFCAQVAPSAH